MLPQMPEQPRRTFTFFHFERSEPISVDAKELYRIATFAPAMTRMTGLESCPKNSRQGGRSPYRSTRRFGPRPVPAFVRVCRSLAKYHMRCARVRSVFQ